MWEKHTMFFQILTRELPTTGTEKKALLVRQPIILIICLLAGGGSTGGPQFKGFSGGGDFYTF